MAIYDEFGNRIFGTTPDEFNAFLDSMPNQEWADQIARNFNFERSKHEESNGEEGREQEGKGAHDIQTQ